MLSCITHPLNVRSTLGGCAIGIGMLVAQPCFAQKAACVNLLVGAGYAAWMGVKFGDSEYWSSSYPIGQYRCIPLPVSGMVNGAPYSVMVSAVLGSQRVPCKPNPSNWIQSDTNSVTYNAWGSTLNVSCEMPLPGANAAAEPVEPSKEGMAAYDAWKKEGAKPAPQ